MSDQPPIELPPYPPMPALDGAVWLAEDMRLWLAHARAVLLELLAAGDLAARGDTDELTLLVIGEAIAEARAQLERDRDMLAGYIAGRTSAFLVDVAGVDFETALAATASVRRPSAEHAAGEYAGLTEGAVELAERGRGPQSQTLRYCAAQLLGQATR